MRNFRFDYTKVASIMANNSSEKTSKKYSFIPTHTVIKLLERNGWYVNDARESRSVKNQGYQKHIVRFRRTVDMGRTLEVNEIIPEAILRTAHDGSANWIFGGGFQRCWCDNQCTVSEGTVTEHKIKHIGYTNRSVLDAINSIAEEMPKIIDKMHELKALEMTGSDKYLFASKAMDLVFDNKKWESYSRYNSIKQLLKARRRQDEDSNMWCVFNTVQENLIKGGRFLITNHMASEQYRSYIDAYGGEKTRGITSIDRGQDLNKALWELAVKFL
jgi:hypothetical protein